MERNIAKVGTMDEFGVTRIKEKPHVKQWYENYDPVAASKYLQEMRTHDAQCVELGINPTHSLSAGGKLAYVFIVDGEFDQVCETVDQAATEKQGLTALGCSVVVKVVPWDEQDAYIDGIGV